MKNGNYLGIHREGVMYAIVHLPAKTDPAGDAGRCSKWILLIIANQ